MYTQGPGSHKITDIYTFYPFITVYTTISVIYASLSVEATRVDNDCWPALVL